MEFCGDDYISEKIKVLQVLHGGPAFGGVETFLVDRYKLMDTECIQFDFAFAHCNNMGGVCEQKGFQESSFFSFNASYPGTERIRYLTFYKKLKTLCIEKHYDIIHIHSGSLLMQFFSYLAIKNVCPKAWFPHAHHANPIINGTQVSMGTGIEKLIMSVVYPFIRKVVCRNATRLFACSREAGKQAFGKATNTSKFEILKNGIELEKFSFNPSIRGELRKKTKTEDKVVFGLVGRLTHQKNPLYAVEVFNAIHEKNPNAVLWIVGNGALKMEIKEKIESLSLQNDVVFWGERTDVDVLMQAMDALLFPSIYEGLGIVAIEAQSSGLPVFASDCIPKDAGCTELMSFWSLDKGADYWAVQIEKILSKLSPRQGRGFELRAAGYDLNDCATRLEQIYREAVKQE